MALRALGAKYLLRSVQDLPGLHLSVSIAATACNTCHCQGEAIVWSSQPVSSPGLRNCRLLNHTLVAIKSRQGVANPFVSWNGEAQQRYTKSCNGGMRDYVHSVHSSVFLCW